MRYLFLLHPGEVISERDGQAHYVSCPELARLYCLPRGRWIAYDDRMRDQPGIHLWPSESGDYFDAMTRFYPEIDRDAL